MGLQSDLTLTAASFQDDAVSKATAGTNAALDAMLRDMPSWWQVGAPEYRAMRDRGETAFPAPVYVDTAKDFDIPSREQGRQIHLRVHMPKSEKPSGVFMHIHGGGWVLSDENAQDVWLKWLADESDLVVASVGYRLAPENIFPAAAEDCYDAADWCVDNAKSQFGAELQFVGGESAGGHLSALTVFHLVNSRPDFRLRGAALLYGIYDLASYLPHFHNFDTSIILSRETMVKFVEAFVPNLSVDARRHPSVSPLYADMRTLAARSVGGALPAAFLPVGTMDVLMDDSVFMAAKWQMAGSEAVLKVYPGAVHGFHLLPPDKYPLVGEFRAHLLEWLAQHGK